jgi:hypothetical protein
VLRLLWFNEKQSWRVRLCEASAKADHPRTASRVNLKALSNIEIPSAMRALKNALRKKQARSKGSSSASCAEKFALNFPTAHK